MRHLLLISMLLAACGGDGSESSTPTPPTDATAEVADQDPDGEVGDDAIPAEISSLRAGKVELEEELIGGEGAYGQVGRAWFIENDRARFLIQDVGVAVGLDLYGGNLIDADVVREDGAPGNDRFREIFPSAGFLVLAPNAITVTEDGTAGDRVVLRVEGTLEKSRILDLLDDVAEDLDLTARQDYILEADSRSLRMVTTLFNPTAVDAAVTIGDFLGFGDQLTLLTREAGFKSPEAAGATGILAARGDGVSYAYGLPSGVLSFPFSDSSGTFGILDYAFVVPAGGEASFERHFVVGDGSLSSVIDELIVSRGDPHGTVVGHVTDESGAAVAGARVTALATDDEAENQAITDEDGRYEMRVSVAEMRLIASAEGRTRSEEHPVSVALDEVSTVDLQVGSRGHIEIRYTTDGPRPGRGESAPVKVSLEALEAEAPDARLGESDVSGQRHMEFIGGGHDGFDVKPGTYRIVVSHGPEFAVKVHDDVVLESTLTLEGHLGRTIDTSGWAGCDFHQHTSGSLDSAQSLQERLRENMSAGLDCAAITDHDNVTNPTETIASLEAQEAFHGVTSSEVSVNGVGHFNAYPLPWDPAEPYAYTGAQFWADKTIPELFETIRALEGDRVIQVNHPRSDAFKGYFAFLGRDPDTGETAMEMGTDFDAIEVNRSLGDATDYTQEGWASWSSTPNSDVPVLADWFGMLNRGEPICAVGNSDTHDVGDDGGYPRTYLRVLDDSPGALTDDDVVTAIALQHAVVARGYVLEVETNGAFHMGHTQVVNGAGDVPVALHVSVRRSLWLETSATVELYENGLHLESRTQEAPLAGNLLFDDTFSLNPEQDAWYVVVVKGNGTGRPVFEGSPFAYANPVYVDADGDGDWTPPGPVGTQE